MKNVLLYLASLISVQVGIYLLSSMFFFVEWDWHLFSDTWFHRFIFVISLLASPGLFVMIKDYKTWK